MVTLALLRRLASEPVVEALRREDRGPGRAPCPCCRRNMQRVALGATYGNVELDLCSHCHVVRLDDGALVGFVAWWLRDHE